jgi:preprotein translocase subunit SecF
MPDHQNLKFFEIIPPGTKFPFVRTAKYFIMVSIVLILGSIGLMSYNVATRGSPLNFGIDFAGGSSVRLALAQGRDVPIQDVREALEGAGYEGVSAVTVPDNDNQILVHVKDVATIDGAQASKCEEAVKSYPKAKLKRFNYTEGASKIFMMFDAQPTYADLDQLMVGAGCVGKADKGTGKLGEFPVEFALIGIGAKIQADLDTKFGDGTVAEIVSSESVGAKVGDQLKTDGIKSLLYAIGFIFLYVMLRFDLRFAPGGIVALAHDAMLTVGAFALTWKEFNLQTIAALLTIIGYSINDTIVVFDRIRERVALNRDQDIGETTDVALNETLSRTILTSGTTLLVVVATWALGTGTIKDFAFALFIGITVGTYSSLFIAAQIFLWVNRRFYGGKGHLLAADAAAAAAGEGTGHLLGTASNEEVDEATGKPTGEVRAEQAAKAMGAAVGDDIAVKVAAKQAAEAALGDDDGEGGEQKASRRRRRQRPSS